MRWPGFNHGLELHAGLEEADQLDAGGTHQGVIVLNLLHGRLSGQGELDGLEGIKLLRGRCTARDT